MVIKYDVLIIGGGTSGCSCAWNCAKLGLKTAIIEKTSVLGGAMTSGLVIPMMNNGDNPINTEFYDNLVLEMKKYNSQIDFEGNSGWFNPEMLKIILDKMLFSAGVDIFYNTEIYNVKINNNYIIHAGIFCNILSPNIYTIHSDNISSKKDEILLEYIEANHYVDATGNGNFSSKINCEFLENKNETQPVNLRFMLGGVDVKKFSEWLSNIDPDRKTTPIQDISGQIHLSTAYTWDTSSKWALKPLFDDAVSDGILKDEDRNYFQVFTVAGMSDTIAFNCPRVLDNVDLSSSEQVSSSLIKGRMSILRLYEFCKIYLKGFENSFISNISDDLGIRVSRRVKGKYVYSADDIIKKSDFENPAVVSDYPIDVHSTYKDSSILENHGDYSLPIESLMSYNYDNLFIIGKCLSADFKAQGALRVQKSCLSMGEAVAKYIAKNG